MLYVAGVECWCGVLVSGAWRTEEVVLNKVFSVAFGLEQTPDEI